MRILTAGFFFIVFTNNCKAQSYTSRQLLSFVSSNPSDIKKKIGEDNYINLSTTHHKSYVESKNAFFLIKRTSHDLNYSYHFNKILQIEYSTTSRNEFNSIVKDLVALKFFNKDVAKNPEVLPYAYVYLEKDDIQVRLGYPNEKSKLPSTILISNIQVTKKYGRR